MSPSNFVKVASLLALSSSALRFSLSQVINSLAAFSDFSLATVRSLSIFSTFLLSDSPALFTLFNSKSRLLTSFLSFSTSVESFLE